MTAKKTAKKAAKKAAKKTGGRTARSKVQEEVKVVHIYPDVEIVEGSRFTEGVPSRLNVSMSYKMTTRQYENMTYQASITLDLKKGADVELATDQAFDFVSKEIGERVMATRKKMSGNQ